MDATTFLKQLHQQVAEHPGVGHSLLGRMTIDPRSKADFKIFAGQHYALVSIFTRYLEILLLRAPHSRAKVWIAKVLVDEYGERSEGADHAEHYGDFMRACGWDPEEFEDIPLHPAVVHFIAEHIRICSEPPWLIGLGAVGPGHEWAIPTMFDYCLKGLHRAGFGKKDIAYFDLHTEQDIDHGAWLEEALANFAETEEEQEQIQQGCLLSLALRERFWWGLADKINAGRMQQYMPMVGSSTSGAEAETTLRQLRKQLQFHHAIPTQRGA
jgi:pyrroloquinoline-quinone synthase